MLQSLCKIPENRQMVLMFKPFDYPDFQRFLYGESWKPSDYFEQTQLKIARFARLISKMILFVLSSDTMLQGKKFHFAFMKVLKEVVSLEGFVAMASVSLSLDKSGSSLLWGQSQSFLNEEMSNKSSISVVSSKPLQTLS